MNAQRIPLHPMAAIQNLAGYKLSLHDRCGAKFKAEVAVDGKGLHFLTVNGKRVSVTRFIGWEALPNEAQAIQLV